MTLRIMSAVMLLAIAAGEHGEPAKQVKGTRVVLSAPPGFVETDRFPGFISEETGASIMVTELQAPIDEATAGFNMGELGRQGMTLLSQEQTKFGLYNGMLMSAAQSAYGVDYLKWMAAFGNDTSTYLVTATFPKTTETNLSEVLKKTVIGARVSNTDPDPFDFLTFRVTPANEMKIAKVIGNSVLMSKGGIFPAKRVETPILVVAASMSKNWAVLDRKAFVEARIMKTAMLKDIETKTTEPIVIDGLEGFESIASAIDEDSATAMMVYQVILFDTEGYYVMQGIASEEEGITQLPTFKQIAQSFSRTKP